MAGPGEGWTAGDPDGSGRPGRPWATRRRQGAAGPGDRRGGRSSGCQVGIRDDGATGRRPVVGTELRIGGADRGAGSIGIGVRGDAVDIGAAGPHREQDVGTAGG